jgi:hypothetical protein
MVKRKFINLSGKQDGSFQQLIFHPAKANKPGNKFSGFCRMMKNEKTMKKTVFAFICFLLSFGLQAQQVLTLSPAKFKTGDDKSWKEKDFNDREWKEINPGLWWEEQGYAQYDGYAWYRIRFYLPSTLLTESYLKEELIFKLAKIDDADETYLNGKRIGKTGSFPSDAEGYVTRYNVPRNYIVRTDDPAICWDQENVLAIRVFDGSGQGGIFDGEPSVQVVDLIDGLSIFLGADENPKENNYILSLKNTANKRQKGKLYVRIDDTQEGVTFKTLSENIRIKPTEEVVKKIPYPAGKRMKMSIVYTDDQTGKTKKQEIVPPYILTPPASPLPQINGAKIFGVRPGSPFLFKIAASGEKPLRYEVKDLPEGLAVNSETGIITGVLREEGCYKMTFCVHNRKGKAEREFTVKAGNTLALTPPMGWNSWNCWGPSVTKEKALRSAQALIDKRLIDYGWTYINIDDCWQAGKRTPDGILNGNDRFPDLKGLGDWLHGNGLKFGIYSSPGDFTCAGYPGSYRHEAIDAGMYAEWGVDYLKYDWCSYSDVFAEEGDLSASAYMKPYLVMQKQLPAQKRDIVYSLCQYGFKDVWEWGAAVDGNCWRTTWDITDTWESLKDIGFSQDRLYPFAKPGHWNDPDMLIVGMLGWGDQLHPTKLTVDEQYTHISLWCLLASPLLMGCDISQLDAFTLSLLTNSEVLDVNQDPLGKQAQRTGVEGNIQVWMKELEDGSKAVGFFNLGESDEIYTIDFQKSGFSSVKEIRDIWRQRNIPVPEKPFPVNIPAHGVVFWKITSNS